MDGVPIHAPDSAAPLAGAAAAAAPTTIVASHFPRDAAARLYATCADDRDDGVVAGLAARHGAFVAAAACGNAARLNDQLGLLRDAEKQLKDLGIVSNGDVYAITCGEPMGAPGGTNMLKICRVS